MGEQSVGEKKLSQLLGEKKLSQLLGEYMEEKKKNPEGFLEISTALMIAGGNVLDVYMISKKFGFIKRLIENCKISREKVYINLNKDINSIDFKSAHIDEIRLKVLLMLLSIQDEQVKFLSEILKDE